MHDIVTKYGKKEEDGTITIDHASARKIAEEVRLKNPQEQKGWAKESWEEGFGEAWVRNDPLDQGKVAADVVPVIMREMARDRTLQLLGKKSKFLHLKK